ncbi:MAG: nucleotidyl transferase AbiEii/AbiGii toxin family protein [Candidatus Rokubacteria bacterium]|nr:nucleotidyl transferase AbiEii/AbiGii toxin family protein [Candidatus Rokubacteria bacterium]
MKYSREYLEERAARTGFRPDTLEKVLRLLRLLDQVTRHPFLGSRLLLKGGTALNLFYAAAPRLSVDLDFNYVGAVDRGQMLRERPEVERAVNQVVMGEDYRVQWGRDEHAGRKVYLTYVSGLGSPDRIEVDLNYLFRVPLVDPETRPAWTPDPDFPCEARIVSREEVMTGKLLALLDRVAARDLYDVAAFAAAPPAYDPSVLRRLFVALSGVLPRALSAYNARHLDRFTQRSMDEDLALMLRSGETPSVETLRARAEALLGQVLGLSPSEAEYVDRIQWGEFAPELVAADQPELLARLRTHPALLWKVENARRRPRP